MSAAEVAIHGGRGRGSGRSSPLPAVTGAERPVMRLVSFSALAGYGVLRWATLENPAPGGRLAGLLVLAVAVAGAGPWLDRHSRSLAIAGLVLGFGGMLAIAGVSASWLTHARVAVIGQAIGQGLSALPNSVVPYNGIDPWLRLVILLGAGMLLLSAASMIAFASGTVGDLRRAGAALALIALAIVPATLVRPRLPYLEGMILFALVGAFVWGERIAHRRAWGAIAVALTAGVGGMTLGPLIEQHHAWVNPRGLAGSLTPVHVDTFDWTQRYGPFSWPRDSRDVIDVKARRPDYWKAENLDLFTGVAWAQAHGASRVLGPSAPELRRFSQTIQVTVRAMNTVEVIGAGYSSDPAHLDQPAVRGASPGTWEVSTPLQPGDSYAVSTYSPKPSAAELRADHDPYPISELSTELAVRLPPRVPRFGGSYEVGFPLFHSRGAVANLIGPAAESGGQVVARSVYGPAYALATRLAGAAQTPYDFAVAIERFLSPANGFVYDERPPPSGVPLESFLFTSRHGYCQQFAGAMALLLRMGGIPARVATGFTTGDYDGAAHRYVVSDLDAHSWVEAWFPRYGWVRFDPTPGSAPARAGGGLLPRLRAAAIGRLAHRGTRRNSLDAGTGAPVTLKHGSGGAAPLAALLAGLLAGLAAVAFAMRILTRPTPSSEQLLAELERALARAGRPLKGGVTLQALEQRFRCAPEAAGYVRRLRLARFAGDAQLPQASQRRALRSELAAGLGVTGRLRAWWALPPRVLH